MKSYNNDETLSGGSACRWYLNEDIPEIDDCFERLGDDFQKVQWISNGAEKFAAKRNRADLPQRSVDELRNMDPWETENTDFLCTVTITKVMPEQPWWFQSCSKCHRSATSYGSEFKCSARYSVFVWKEQMAQAQQSLCSLTELHNNLLENLSWHC
ncbi:hypothetical protein VPH35_067103 [Triticum aestivum]